MHRQQILPAPEVFIVDNDTSTRDSLAWLVESAGLRATTFESAEAFLSSCQSDRPGCLVLDIRLPGMSGVQLARQLRRSLPSLRVLLMSGYAREEFASGPNAVDDLPFIPKPFATRTVVERLRSLIEPAPLQA